MNFIIVVISLYDEEYNVDKLFYEFKIYSKKIDGSVRV
jgi:hypothetical protein